MATNLDGLAYDLSLRALSQQENLLNELRARTGMLLAATAITASFLGARALDSGGTHALDLLGMAFALLSLVLCIYVLAPKGHLTFAIDGPAAYEYFLANRVPLQEAERDLAYWNREVWEENQLVIDSMVRRFRWACYALVGAVVVWSVGLGIQ